MWQAVAHADLASRRRSDSDIPSTQPTVVGPIVDQTAPPVPATWGDQGGPVNVFSSPAAPVAMVQSRFNPASGGREGYVVFIQLVVIPKP